MVKFIFGNMLVFNLLFCLLRISYLAIECSHIYICQPRLVGFTLLSYFVYLLLSFSDRMSVLLSAQVISFYSSV